MTQLQFVEELLLLFLFVEIESNELWEKNVELVLYDSIQTYKTFIIIDVKHEEGKSLLVERLLTVKETTNVFVKNRDFITVYLFIFFVK